MEKEISRAIATVGCSINEVILVVSGELTYTGKSTEFGLVDTCLKEVCQRLGMRVDQVALVPGNHDVDWQLARIDLTHRFDHYLSFACAFYGRSLFQELYPFVKW